MKNLNLIISFILFFASSVKSQVSNDKVLEAFLSDTAFGKYFIPGFFKQCDSIAIIDTANCFTADAKIKFSKRIIIKHHFDEKRYSENKYFASKVFCEFLFVNIKKEKKNRIVLNYFHPASNGAGFVRYKIIKRRLKKVKYEYGQY
jgi:hypothetical protein